MERRYTIRDISTACGIAMGTDYSIAKRGYFSIRLSESNPGCKSPYRVVERQFVIANIKTDDGRVFYNQAAFDNFLEGVRPNKEHWPLASEVESNIGGDAKSTSVAQLWRRGSIRGRTSLIERRLHIHPQDARILEVVDSKYYLYKFAREMEVTPGAVRFWDRNAPQAFIVPTVGKRKALIPKIARRLKVIRKTFGMISKESLSRLYDSDNEFHCYVRGSLYYDPESPLKFTQCVLGKKLYYEPFGTGEIIELFPDKFQPSIKVRFRPEHGGAYFADRQLTVGK